MATVSSVLSQIRTNESGGNYTAQNPTSTASGAYQFVNGTWSNLTQQSGIGTQYATAKSAPPYIQDAVATYALEQNPNANSSSLWGGGTSVYAPVTSYDVSSSQIAASGTGFSGASSIPQGDTTNQGFGSNSTTQYQVLGTQGEPVGVQYGNDPSGLPSGYSIGQPLSSTGATTGNTTGTGASGAATTAAGGTGVGMPVTVGLQPGAATTIAGVGTNIGTAVTGAGNTVGSAITGVGTSFTNFFKNWLTSLENWFGRGFLIFIAVIIIAIALWRMLEDNPSVQLAIKNMARAPLEAA